MPNSQVSLTSNQSANLFNELTLTHNNVIFKSYSTAPPELNLTAVQKHSITIYFSLQANGILMDHFIVRDDSEDNDSFVTFMGYKISLNGLNGYNNTEVTYLVEKLSPQEISKQYKKDSINVFNARSLTVILNDEKPVVVFDSFSIAYIGIKNSTLVTKVNADGTKTRGKGFETLLLSISGFNETSEQSIRISSSENNDKNFIKWHNYKIIYLSRNRMDIRLTVEELPVEVSKCEKNNSLWAKFLIFFKQRKIQS